MDQTNQFTLNHFDNIRLKHGNDSLTSYFRGMAANGRERAISFINDKNLRFCTLYILRNELKKPGIYEHLSSRNKSAIEITEKILSKNSSDFVRQSSDRQQMSRSTLNWILQTGYPDDGLSPEYDEFLDSTALLLVKTYRDLSVLNIILNMIFTRYEKGFFINDLVWAFFEAREPKSLFLIADRLRSAQSKDVDLACKLLNFIPNLSTYRSYGSIKLYSYAYLWLYQNFSYLYYAGESFQQCCNPKPYEIAYEAKYLCRPVSVDSGRPIQPFTLSDYKLLDAFTKLDAGYKVLLSSYSVLLHSRNLYSWNTWLQFPIDEQIRIAEMVMGGLQ